MVREDEGSWVDVPTKARARPATTKDRRVTKGTLQSSTSLTSQQDAIFGMLPSS
ncbi:hypothetical protein HanRHA438_Chr07g0311521 [Helianthus annuus]|uniref:Uncharacterized protein n=1 Tax=Helianthus annuus TaxID=4232 RepID=A0A9K3NH01_HELAN|nr:hypothetical protein HanXRQr2_Chr07g0301581 [Helianthus annuus]KAJ0908537.1 hypothetical protein HanRHA438_Chr07g0311521 [Helianthus annuus]